MKKTLVLIGMFFSVTAMAKTDITTFRCVTDKVIEGNSPTVIEFQVQELNTKEATYYTVDPDSYEPVKTTPEYSTLMLNENWGISQEADRLEMDSDGDGCQLTDFVLYKNSGYKRGWVRVRDLGCGASPSYSTVTCNVK